MSSNTVGLAETPGRQFHRPKTAQQAVLAELRGLISRGELPPGSTLAQDTLADRFGVSRVPVREAMRILEGEGRLTHSPHRGYTVPSLSVDELLETLVLRGLLESHVVEVAVPRLGEQDLRVMQGAIEAMDQAADESDMVGVGVQNRIFHFAVFEPSGLHRTIRIIHQLWDSIDPYRALYFVKPMTRASVNAEHRRILQACRARDAGLVNDLLATHRRHTVDDLRAMPQDLA